MIEFKKFKIKDIADTCLGKMLDAQKNTGDYQPYLANINVRWGGFDLKDLGKMRFEDTENERYGIKHGDLIICEGGEPGRCALWKDALPNMKIQKALHRVRVKKGVSSEFLYYRFLLAGRTGEIKKHFIGSTIKHLTGIGLGEVEFSFPSFQSQQKIAAVLSSLDAKIELNKRINAELEAMAKTLYDYWFVQFDFPCPRDIAVAQSKPKLEGKPYKSSGGRMVWNAELKREIPEGWEVTRISQLAPILTGKEDANFASSEGQFPFFTCGEEALKCNLPAFSGKAVLLAGNGNFSVKHFEGAFNAYQRTYVVIPNNEKHYAILYFMVKDQIKSLTNGSRGSIIKFLTRGDIEEIAIAMPIDKSDVLFTILNKMLRKIEDNIFENQELISLRDFLLPLLMNGQVSVR